MNERKHGYIDVDSLQRELASQDDVVERIATFYNVQLSQLHQTQQETRMACGFDCGKTEATSDRAISVKTDGDVPLWRCFHLGCTVRGNILSLMHWTKHNRAPSGNRLQGAEFREIASDLAALVRGEDRPTAAGDEEAASKQDEQSVSEPPVNVALKDSENERARALVTLDEKFVRDVAEMNPKAAAYIRQRPYLTPEMMEQYRCGYLPSSGGSLLRGQFVYSWPDAEGNILTWFGRNLNYEEQHRKWKRSGDSKDEPHKFRFVKGFHRGLELYGETQFNAEASDSRLQENGIIVVEGPNDVMALNAIGVPAVAVCSNTITTEQADKLASIAERTGCGTVSVMFDLDREGINGSQQAILEIAKRCRTRFVWTTELAGGQFKGRQPESVTIEEWETAIHPALIAVL